ncbi:hypothetical protein K3729_12860 [Rhodobacteraceae bacterium S2214]|nr:hypothetical protein K3729_12860 [Rhodobacteraceae bacterium S2214]
MFGSVQPSAISKAVAIAALAGCGINQSPEICEVLDISHRDEAPIDAGAGFVLQEGGYQAGPGGASYLTLNNCTSGEKIRFTYLSYGFEQSNTSLNGNERDYRIDARDELPILKRMILDQARPSTIDEIIGFAEESGMYVWRETPEDQSRAEEDCGCALFYPELRGDKDPSRKFTQREENRVN